MEQLLETAINRFRDYLKFEKRYSPHTLKAYGDDLINFRDYLQHQFGGMEIGEISAPVVRSWLASLKENGMDSRSIKRKISTLKSFFKFSLRLGIVHKSPVTNIVSPKISQKLPTYVEQEDMDALFRQVKFPDDWAGQTARLVMLMLYQLGLRLSELVNCRESQIDFGNATIKVLGKGSKERIIPASNDLLSEIGKYISRKTELPAEADREFLLVSAKGKKLYPKYIYSVTNKYLKMVTTVKKKSPHVLRHSFATHLSNNGAELNAIKELLGHASLAATQIYTHSTIKKLKNVHKNAHPRG